MKAYLNSSSNVDMPRRRGDAINSRVCRYHVSLSKLRVSGLHDTTPILLGRSKTLSTAHQCAEQTCFEDAHDQWDHSLS